MEKEQVELLIKAANISVNSNKTFYDYLILVLPVITGILGYVAAIWWQSHIFKKNTVKDHYYIAREKVEAISTQYGEFLEYLYDFYKGVKNTLNESRGIDEDRLTDFVTNCQFKLASIHQKQRIVFPGKSFPTINITNEIEKLEKNIKNMNGFVHANKDTIPYPIKYEKRLQDMNNISNNAIGEITTEAAKIENEIIELLNKRAKQIGIKEF